jgi:preprotein translocase subunit SecE
VAENQVDDPDDFGAVEAEDHPHPSHQIVEHRPSGPARLVGFLKGCWRELQRVQWPDRRQVMQATGVVLGFVVVAGIFLGISDLVASKLMNLVLK